MTAIEKAEIILAKVNLPARHSMFQLNFFVVNNEPTVQAKMKRCLDEMRARLNSLQSIDLQIADHQDHNLLLDKKLAKITCVIKRRIFARRLQKNELSIIELQRVKKGTEEELSFFMETFLKFNEEEAFKSVDDYKSQCDYWDNKINQEISYRLAFGMPIDVELLKTALCLPETLAAKQKALQLMENKCLTA